MAVAFSVIFMAHFEKQLLNASPYKALVWERFFDDIFPVWTISETDFINSFHATIKFTHEMSSKHIVFLDTEVFRRLIQGKIPDVQTHFKPTETFQYTHFDSCHPLSVRRAL